MRSHVAMLPLETKDSFDTWLKDVPASQWEHRPSLADWLYEDMTGQTRLPRVR